MIHCQTRAFCFCIKYFLYNFVTVGITLNQWIVFCSMWGFDCCPKVHFDGIPVNHKCMTLNSFSCMTVFYRKNIKGKTEAVLVDSGSSLEQNKQGVIDLSDCTQYANYFVRIKFFKMNVK